jgi:hypothetical protein
MNQQTPHTNNDKHVYTQGYTTNHSTPQPTTAQKGHKPCPIRPYPDIRTYGRIQTAANPSTYQPTEHTTPTTTDTNRHPTIPHPHKTLHVHDTHIPLKTQKHTTVQPPQIYVTHNQAMSPPPRRQQTHHESWKRQEIQTWGSPHTAQYPGSIDHLPTPPLDGP